MSLEDEKFCRQWERWHRRGRRAYVLTRTTQNIAVLLVITLLVWWVKGAFFGDWRRLEAVLGSSLFVAVFVQSLLSPWRDFEADDHRYRLLRVMNPRAFEQLASK